MAEIVRAFACAEGGDERGDSALETRNRSFCGLAQKSFEFGKGQFDRVEVRRIPRQVTQCCARGFDGFPHPDDFMSLETVNNDGVPGLEYWNQALLKIGKEN